jgi:inhibitor of cysteine peptidase
MLKLVENDNERTVNIHVDETAQIILPENATTGFRWAIDYCDEQFLEVISSAPGYTPDAVGSVGEVVFIIRGKKTGIGEIRLKNWRSWESDGSVINRFRVRFTIVP